MLNHDDAVAGVDEGVEGEQETLYVVAMEAGGGFVEQEESAG